MNADDRADITTIGDPAHPVGNPDTHETVLPAVAMVACWMSVPMIETMREVCMLTEVEMHALVRTLLREALAARGTPAPPDFHYADGCAGYLDA